MFSYCVEDMSRTLRYKGEDFAELKADLELVLKATEKSEDIFRNH